MSTRNLVAAGFLFAAGVIVGVLIASAQLVVVAQGATDRTNQVGVWRLSEVRTTGPNARTITNPQPNILIITPHYSCAAFVTPDAAPRPELPPRDKATDKQLADAFRSFGAYATKREVNGNEITTRRIVDLIPNGMRAGNFQTMTFRFEGRDTMWTTGKATENGAIANPSTNKFTRLE